MSSDVAPAERLAPLAVDAPQAAVEVDRAEHVAREVEEARALGLHAALGGDVARDAERADRRAGRVAKRALRDRQDVALGRRSGR